MTPEHLVQLAVLMETTAGALADLRARIIHVEALVADAAALADVQEARIAALEESPTVNRGRAPP